MNKSQSKYFNTAVKIDDAFISLLEKKDFEYITVKEICKLAGVNRSTFYLHYETLGELVTECVERMNEDFIKYFKAQPVNLVADVRTEQLDNLFLITPEYIIPYLNYIKTHKKLFRVVMLRSEVLQTDKTYNNMLYPFLDKVFARFSVPEKERAYFMDFYIGGLMRIVKRWLKGDCRESTEQITEIIVKVIKQ